MINLRLIVNVIFSHIAILGSITQIYNNMKKLEMF